MNRGRPPGTFKLANRKRSFELYADPWSVVGEQRVNRIIASLQADIGEGGVCRVRQILERPRALYRLEIERPDVSYERTTILDSGALEELLEQLPEDLVRESFRFS